MTRTLAGDEGPARPSAYSTLAEDPGLPALVARLRAAGCVFAEEEAAELLLAARSRPDGGTWLERAVTERVVGRPLELVVGRVAFGGLRLAVAAGTFVPRVRTELLAEVALEGLPAGGRVL
ncbi:MAG TPA: hypothetical protein VGE77_03940, partial [Nocardioides sp.]